MTVRYRHKNSELHIDTGAKGKFYVNGGLRFMGDSYTAMKMFIAHSNNDPNVMKEFKTQLEMREQVKWKRDDERMKEEERQKQESLKRETQRKQEQKKQKREPISKAISRSRHWRSR